MDISPEEKLEATIQSKKIFQEWDLMDNMPLEDAALIKAMIIGFKQRLEYDETVSELLESVMGWEHDRAHDTITNVTIWAGSMVIAAYNIGAGISNKGDSGNDSIIDLVEEIDFDQEIDDIADSE